MHRTPKGASTPSAATSSTIARFEVLRQEAEQLTTVEAGQAKAFNQGRASAFALVLDELRGIEQ